ncbi:ABC transporter substrate-binding protein [Chloroflexota bacterium]
MITGFKGSNIYLVGTFLGLSLLVGCSIGGEVSPSPTTPPAGETQASLQITSTPTLQPTPTIPPRTLTICLGAEPDTLFIYGGASLAQNHILEAIYDGPLDRIGYQYQPVILEKLPNLADGDANLAPISVQAGDWVVNNAGQLVQLNQGEIVRPAGCSQSDCAIAWDGGPLEMDQLSATFTLKEGIRWSDSTPLTAADSVFSYQIAKLCQADFGPCGGLGLVSRQGWETLPRTADYTAINERNVRWSGVPGFMDPDYQSNFFIPLPEHQLTDYPVEDLFTAQETARQPLGWGPYVISSWVPGEFINMRKNPSYFRVGEAEPRFDQLIFRFIGQDPERNLDALTTGGCDLLDQGASFAFMSEDLEELNQLEDSGQLQAQFSSGPVWEHADFGIQPLSYEDGYQPGVDRPDFFRDVRVRQAFAMCMDRQKIVEEVLAGRSRVPDSYLPDEHPLFNPDLPSYGFDPTAGGQLLEQIGWVDDDSDPKTPRIARGIQGVIDGMPLKVAFTTSTAMQRQAASQILAASLAECGVELELNYGLADEVFAPGPEGPVFGRRFDLAQFAWSTSTQPPCELWTRHQIPGDPILVDEDGLPLYPYGWGGVNETGFADLDYDHACLQALETLPGQTGYLENHQVVQQIFADQLPVIPLYQHLKLAVTRPDMCGFILDASASSEMWNIENFDYGEGCP